MCSGGDEPAGRVISSTTVSIPGAQRCSTTKVSRNHHACACSFSGGINNCCRHFGHLLVRTRPAQVVRYPYHPDRMVTLRLCQAIPVARAASGPRTSGPCSVSFGSGSEFSCMRESLPQDSTI
jgi:hypothetical protein